MDEPYGTIQDQQWSWRRHVISLWLHWVMYVHILQYVLETRFWNDFFEIHILILKYYTKNLYVLKLAAHCVKFIS